MLYRAQPDNKNIVMLFFERKIGGKYLTGSDIMYVLVTQRL